MLPKYTQISQDIIATIRNGELEPGERTMSENEIIARYNVSNTTARRALMEVERAGWVRRIKGKGTVVREQRVGRSVDRILGFTRNMREAGRTPSTRLLDVQKRPRGRTLSFNGQHYELPGPLYIIERLRLADGVPVMEETRHISAALCPDLSTHDLEGSLYDLYEVEYGLVLTEVKQILSAVQIEHKRLMRLFDLETPVPAFLVEGVTFCGRDTVLEMEESLYRGDQYQFSLTANRRS